MGPILNFHFHLTSCDRRLAVKAICGGGGGIDVQHGLLTQPHQVRQTSNLVVEHGLAVPAILGRLKTRVGEEASMRKTRVTRRDAGVARETVRHLQGCVKNKQDHVRMNVAPDQTIILGLQIFLDHRSLSSIDQKILMTLPHLPIPPFLILVGHSRSSECL